MKKSIIIFLIVVCIGLAVGGWIFLKKQNIPLSTLFKKPGLIAHFSLEASISDTAGIDPKTTFVLKIDKPVSKNTVRKILKFIPETDFEVKNITNFEVKNITKSVSLLSAVFAQGEGNGETIFEIWPTEPLKENEVYNIVIDDVEGVEREYSWAFQVKSPFQVIQTNPRNQGTYVPINSGIEVAFNRENLISPQNYFEISPIVSGTFEQSDGTLVFLPKNLAEKTIYTVTVKKGLKSEGSDEVLSEDYTFAFETSEKLYTGQKPSFEFSDDFMEFVPDKKLQIGIDYYNFDVTNVEIGVYKFSNAEEFLNSYQSSRHWQFLWASYYNRESFSAFEPNETQKLFSFKPVVGELNYQEFIEIPQTLESGYYLLDLMVDGKRRQAWLEVTPISHYFSITHDKGFLWIYDFQKKEPLLDLDVSYFDKTSGTMVLGKTNNNGLIEFSTPDGLKEENKNLIGPKFFKLEKNGYLPVVAKISNGYYSNVEKGDLYWDFLSTDRYAYQINDTIKYWGVIKGRKDDLRQKKVEVGIFGYSGYRYWIKDDNQALASQEVLVSQFDTIYGELAFKGMSPGYYSIQVKFGDEILATASVEILSYTKPAYQILVTPSKNSIFAGESVDFGVRAEFFDGTPVSGLSLKYSGYWNNKAIDGELTLNENGEGKFTYAPAYFDYPEDNSNYWPRNLTISFLPKLSEEGEISASGNVLVFGPNIHLQAMQKDETDNNYKFTAKLNRIVIGGETQSSSDYRSNTKEYIGEPVADCSLFAKIVKATTIKIEKGEHYDPINKIVVKDYDYTTNYETIEQLNGTTDRAGEWSFAKNLPQADGVSYRIVFWGNDDKGRKLESSIHAFKKFDSEKNFSASLYIGSELNDKQFSVGEKIKLEFKILQGEKPANPQILFYRYQNNIEKVSLAQNFIFEESFEKSFIPSVQYRAIIFGPDGFEETNAVTSSIKKEDYNLKIDIKPEKDKYRPGEEVKADINIKDKDGKPVVAEVNVAVVDEALFHILPYSWQPKILETLYRNIYVTPLTGSSHYSLKSNYPGGAEMGGCFGRGTSIMMADENSKPIEKIKVGDEVLTFLDENNRKLTTAVVQGISEHFVDEHLVINGSLVVTPEHKIYINDKWEYAGNIKIGDRLLGKNGLAQKVFSIERKQKRNFSVYNILVGEYHTYFADGYFVHNAEKGGGPIRTNFVDVVMYESLHSDNDGKITIKFTAPDNITAWRTTAIAFSTEAMQVGQGVELIKTSLPFFVDATLSNYYLVGDRPVFRLRAFSSDFKQNEPTEFGIKSPTLNLDRKATSQNNAFYFAIDSLLEGEHEIVFSAKQGNLQDSLLRKIKVVKSYFRKSESSMYNLSDGLSNIEGDKDGFTKLVFMDEGKGKFYGSLWDYAYTDGIRVDQVTANFFGKKLLAQYFGEPLEEDSLDLSGYHTADGGISLLPYSDNDLELSAKMADLASDFVFQNKLKNYLYNSLQDKKADIHRIPKALYGLAALKEPVLAKINLVKENQELNFEDKIYLGLALAKLGGKEGARKIYEDALRGKIRFQGGEGWLADEQDKTRQVKLTGLMGVLASYLSIESDSNALWNYIASHNPEKDLDVIEELLLVKSELARSQDIKVKFSFRTNSRGDSVVLEKGKTYALNLSSEELASIRFSNIEGKISLASFYERDKNPEELQKNNELTLTRRYFVNKQPANSFEEGDVVMVRLDPTIAKSAIDGSYQVIDYLPSGLRPITRIYEKGLSEGHDECNPIWYPSKIVDNAVYLNIWKGFEKTKNCNHRTLNYYARVVSRGSYDANPALIQSLKDLNSLNISPRNEVEIK